MTLTVVVGSSGSGKTTFLNHVHEKHKCVYIRQYHNLRPYIKVSKIPNFDPSNLPYWQNYVSEKEDSTIRVGGTMAGQFTPGLSGGQRKLLLFEVIYQRTLSQSDLLIVLDEPFAGVTDDFVPFIVDRLTRMKEKHNILLVTNDHVDELKNMADNIIVVSAIDRNSLQINDHAKVDRNMALELMSVGKSFEYSNSTDDLNFFFKVEVASNFQLAVVALFTIFSMGIFTLSFWDSKPGTEALMITGNLIVAYFCLNPYLLALTDWRVYMIEESEALIHSSKFLNKTLKSILTITLLILIDLLAYGVMNLIIDTLSSFKILVAVLFDTFSLTLPFILMGVYTDLPFELVQIFSSMPFLFMIFFSTTFSPGSGVAGVKALRYLFSRFYFWCIVPGVSDLMDGCPETENLSLGILVVVSFIPLILFTLAMMIKGLKQSLQKKNSQKKRNMFEKDKTFIELQKEIFRADTDDRSFDNSP